MSTIGRRAAIAVVACLGTSTLFAQSEKVSVQMTPKPNQDVRVTMQQQMDMSTSFDGNAAANSMNMSMTMTMGMRIKTGAVKPDGNFDAEMTYEQVSIDATLNGQPLPAGNPGNPLAGKAIVLTYNANGDVVDVKGPIDPAVPAELFKQMFTALSGNLPGTPLAVGESVTAPFDFGFGSLPLAIPGAAGMNLSGDATVKLLSIGKDARGRIATFESTMNGTMVTDVPSANGKATSSLEFTSSGGGTMVKDLETGMLRTGEMTSSFLGRVRTTGATSPSQPPGMTMKGHVNVSFTSN